MKGEENWFVIPDLFQQFAEPAAEQTVCLTRTGKGITMLMTGSRKAEVILEVDPTLTVYPFICFNSDVQSVEVRDFRIRERTGAQCCVCLQAMADQVCIPCSHIFYCTDCLPLAEICLPAQCPCCNNTVSKFMRVFFS